jgi:hypothetical protein
MTIILSIIRTPVAASSYTIAIDNHFTRTYLSDKSRNPRLTKKEKEHIYSMHRRKQGTLHLCDE